MEIQSEIKRLQEKLQSLEKQQAVFSAEISLLKKDIHTLQQMLLDSLAISQKSVTIEVIQEKSIEVIQEVKAPNEKKIEQEEKPTFEPVQTIQFPTHEKKPSNWERFIGENLINKIGILILVIGIAIGAKYAIDKDLIGAGMRILLGYLAGGLLAGVALLLKRKYHDFSAVLVSGSAAVFYFMTYIAYSFYGFFSLPIAFILMLLITAATVYAALHYQRQIIAHLGLVGAYAIPFLVNNNSGKMGLFFTYIAIINVGILAVSLKKYWKSLYYVSFGVTWFIFLLWYTISYSDQLHFYIAAWFILATYITFYAVSLGYKIIHGKIFTAMDIIMLLANSLLFYLFGIGILSRHPNGNDWYALFTVFNAVLHALISVIIYFTNAKDKHIIWLSTGLAVVYLTLAVPVQFDGSKVSLIWLLEGALLAFIGIKRKNPIYEKLSFALLILGFLSLIGTWISKIETKAFTLEPILNLACWTGIIAAFLFFGIDYLSRKREVESQLKEPFFNAVSKNLNFILFLGTLFFTLQTESYYYWKFETHQTYKNALNLDFFFPNDGNRYISNASSILIALLYFNLLFVFLKNRFKSSEGKVLLLIFSLLTLVITLITGLLTANSLQKLYVTQMDASVYYRGFGLIGVRYIMLFGIAGLVWNIHRFVKENENWKEFIPFMNIIFHVVLISLISSEWIYWMNYYNQEKSFKLGLSILWGLYSLVLIVLGIKFKMQSLRIAAISLFGITLLKLFAYDIAHLNTLAKTIVFISLGVLLLIISFLYTKYKDKF